MSIGRKRKRTLEEAIDIILESDVPVSTNELTKHMDMTDMEKITFRRGLRRAEEDGKIKAVTKSPNGSIVWISAEISETRCVAMLVNMYLDSLDTIKKVDTSSLEGMIKDAIVTE